MKTKLTRTRTRADIDAKALMFGVFGLLLCIPMTFAALNYFEQTEAPPLVAITIDEAGCEYVAANGLSIEKHARICRIKVRYRKDTFSDGGAIQLDTGGNLQLSAGQVVGMTTIDDGSDVPWTDDHRRAAILMGALFMVVIFCLWVMSRATKRSTGHGP